MVITLTVWQKKRSGYPTRAGQGQLEDPSHEAFDAAVGRLLTTVEESALPFQIVAQVGNSSRGLQLGPDLSKTEIVAQLWSGYLTIAGANG